MDARTDTTTAASNALKFPELFAQADQIAVDQRLINERKGQLYREARARGCDETELKVRIYGESARKWGKNKKAE